MLRTLHARLSLALLALFVPLGVLYVWSTVATSRRYAQEVAQQVDRDLAARLVRTHDLPPKVLTLHQFNLRMIRERERLDTTLDEIQWLLHADGQGAQGDMQATWTALRRGLPEGVWLGWKNFEHEDAPMLTVEQTMERVVPRPSFVSY